MTFRNPGFHAREVTLHASRNASAQDWEEVVAAVRDGSLDATGWVNHRSTLTSVVDDLPHLASSPGDVVKAVVDIDPIGGTP